jgi:hypothetical protein
MYVCVPIAAESENSTALHAIETAILHVCLDVSTPVGPSERFERFLHGSSSNDPRWYDKTISLIWCVWCMMCIVLCGVCVLC